MNLLELYATIMYLQLINVTKTYLSFQIWFIHLMETFSLKVQTYFIVELLKIYRAKKFTDSARIFLS